VTAERDACPPRERPENLENSGNLEFMGTTPCGRFPRVGSYEELVGRDQAHDCAGLGPHHICVRVDAVADLPTRFGRFKIIAFWNNRDGKDHIAMVHGDVMGLDSVLPLRV